MALFLFRLGRWSYLRRWLVIGIWAVLLAAVGGGSLVIQKGYNDVFSIDGVPSQHATQMLMDEFPGTDNPAEASDVNLVFQAPEGEKLSDEKYMGVLDDVVDAVRADVDDFGDDSSFGNPVVFNDQQSQMVIDTSTEMGLPRDVAEADAANVATLSPDGRTGTTSFAFDVDLPADVTPADKDAVNDALDIARDAGLKAEAGGAGFGDPIVIEPISEAVGLLAAFIILFITFGSLIAAGMPLISAVVGVGIGALGITGATAFVPLNNITPVLGIMLGLAVAIDYALFIMSRYRDEVRHGRSRPDATGLAVGTAGSAVVFAGLTVIIALVGLRVANIEFLSYMGYAAAATVLLSVFVALTLVPALFGAFGGRVFRKDAATGAKVREGMTVEDADAAVAASLASGSRGSRRTRGQHEKKARRAQSSSGPSLGTRWVQLVHRAPGGFLLVVVASLVLLTLPAMNLQLSLPSDKTSPVDSTQRQSAELMEEGFGAGRNSPFLVIVNTDDVKPDSAALAPLVSSGIEPAQAAFVTVKDRLGNNVGVKHSQLIGASEDGSTAQILVTPETGPTDERTAQLIQQLRAQQNVLEDETGVDMGITGLVPIQQDVTDRLSDAMPVYLALVVGLALVLLLMVFRSLMVPVMAAAGFLLSVGAAFGVTVLFWQEGLWGLINSPGPLISFMPIFLIGVTFGLAMDYQVFIVSRMRERFTLRSHEAAKTSKYNAVEDSVIGGFGLGAKVVTAAALIMICVFASFIAQPLPFIQIFGFALGVGVLFDAFFIRMTLIPALMFLCGRATWYMPRWLDRILPSVDVEGAKLEDAYSSGKIRRMEDSQVSESSPGSAGPGSR
ncbi:multidrug RND transporter [Corynebacterium sp. CNJ-954]|uniref:MMPL family transporter n=1 Tax=Corynebacterium sp. CNJ-954 TaxID=1904962 RepID=UPI0009641FA4|nr:MMPL family transporter [Corynebacterium sp. CNJ-954]OLT51857.1 multidrug RND transporter [Corynebacterium sp. CNJ-954]